MDVEVLYRWSDGEQCMKRALVAAALLMAASPAWAEDMDFSTIKCKDFISSEKSDIAIVLAWLEGSGHRTMLGPGCPPA